MQFPAEAAEGIFEKLAFRAGNASIEQSGSAYPILTLGLDTVALQVNWSDN
jgi:hypothetical protein